MARQHSLRTYLAVFAVVLTVATAAVLALVTEDAATRQLEQHIGDSLALRAREMADKLDRGMYERRQDIQVETRALTDLGLHNGPAFLRKRLDALRKASASYAWIGYADTVGTVRAATDGLLEGQNVAQRPWFSGAVNTAFTGDVHQALLLEKHLNPGGREPLRFMDVAMPVFDDKGTFAGVLGAHIDWRWVRDATSTSDDGQPTETLILSAAGTVLLGPRELQDKPLALAGIKAAQQGFHGYRIERWPDGRTYLAGYSLSRGYQNYPGLGWVVIVREQLDNAYAPVKVLSKKFLIVGTAIALLFAALGWFLAVTISRPLITITNAALSLQQDQSKVAFPINNGFREVAVLSRSLASLVDTLRQRETQLQDQAMHQSVTGLPNRLYFTAMLDEAIGAAAAGNKQLAIVAFCLDRFNTITDALDNAAGNTALLQMLERIKTCIDGAGVLGHLDKEEFVLLLQGRETLLSRATALASRLQQALAAPVHIRGLDFTLGASAGISVYPDNGVDAETLLRHSEAALQQTRARGGNGIQIFEREAHARILERLAMERDLRHALKHKEFELFYQPQFSFSRNAIVGVEALIRWRHPARGMVSPALFIPAAEACGLISPIGDWVLEQACAQARAWREQGLPELTISVNVSAPQFIGGELARKVGATLAAHGIDPRQLKLEITESMVMQDAELGIAVMRELVALGLRVSLDDFGTGYSSLSNLKRFPLSELKIDQAFVRELAPRTQDAAIVRAIIAIGHDLGLSVIAEGVETAAQLDFLLESGCNAVQGYHIGKPVSAADLAARLREQA
ncbi:MULTISPECIES: EAL domain-containing protein [unclassified Massilia]|uniref:bifunctional diguanylate cyclase/phosphodiesterase n=1 Tax=unclassified Massilia TaxID=2609279 RepID=UPI0009EB2FD7|nr:MULTISPECIES: EAL domain-containing protein [unclassified Massilia]